MIARRRGKNDRAVSDLLAESQLTKSIKSRATFLDITPRTLETWRKKGLTPYIRIAGRAVGCVFLRNDIHRKGLYYDDFPGREQRFPLSTFVPWRLVYPSRATKARRQPAIFEVAERAASLLTVIQSRPWKTLMNTCACVNSQRTPIRHKRRTFRAKS